MCHKTATIITRETDKLVSVDRHRFREVNFAKNNVLSSKKDGKINSLFSLVGKKSSHDFDWLLIIIETVPTFVVSDWTKLNTRGVNI